MQDARNIDMRDARDIVVPEAREIDSTGHKPVATPLTDADLIGLGDRAFAGLRSLVLAVSGGPDSMALMLLAARWLPAAAPKPVVHVATVDHGLRPGSTDEAKWVAQQAAAMGFTHHVLTWEGDKPATGRQAAAREARYGLLAGLIDHLSLPTPAAIAVAHHRDDQAETVLMRLARGSGLDGLAGMLPSRPLTAVDCHLVRPFLDVDKVILLATLRARGIAWLDDPSNANTDFERVRLRQAMAAAQDLGLSNSAIATSARRLGRARAALEQMTNELIARAVETPAGAYARIDAAAFDAAPAELRLRLIQRVIARFGGNTPPPRMTRLEELTERLSVCASMTATLGGCQLRRTHGSILAFREPGRRGLPEIELQPGATATWDGRFRVSVGRECPGAITVKAASVALMPVKTLRKTHHISNLPRRAVLALPSFWYGGHLLAVSHLSVAPEYLAKSAGFSKTSLKVEFIPL